MLQRIQRILDICALHPRAASNDESLRAVAASDRVGPQLFCV